MAHTIAKNHPVLETLSKQQSIQRWGGCISEAILYPAFQLFQAPHIEGFIGYKVVDDCAVVFGDPICAEEHKPTLAKAFSEFCVSKNMPYVFIVASEPFAKWAINNISKIMIEVGQELIFTPQIDPTQGRKAQKLRNKMHHAQTHQISIKEYLEKDSQIEETIQRAGQLWLNARKGPQLYLGELDFFDSTEGRRWFYAKKDDEIFAAALLTKLEAHQGWLLKFLITIPTAPRGTSELLLVSIFETLRNENCNFVTYGITPAKKLGEIIGLGKITQCLARGAFQMIKWMFRLNKRQWHWKQFLPKTMPKYILFSDNRILHQTKALMKALNVGHKS